MSISKKKMTGRDIHEAHRAATTLELLFDLVMVVAVGTASSGLHHAIVAGHFAEGITSYCFCFFTIWLAWWNFSWFASAYDTDDTQYRLTVFVQMVGAMIMAVGQKAMFESGSNMAMGIVGYVVMRLALVSQWLRAARDDEKRHRTCLTYAWCISVAQVGWCLSLLLTPGTLIYHLYCIAFVLFEISIPFIAERHGTIPWHPHHIAERYGLLTIIVLGEGVLGSINATGKIVVDATLMDWLPGVLTVCFATGALTFALWWHYFHVPFGEILERQRYAAVPFGYIHYFIFASLAAVGTGFEVLSDSIANGWDRALLGRSLSTILIAVAIYFLSMLLMRSRIISVFQRHS